MAESRNGSDEESHASLWVGDNFEFERCGHLSEKLDELQVALKHATPLKDIVSGTTRPPYPNLGPICPFDLEPFFVDLQRDIFVIVDYIGECFNQFSFYGEKVPGYLA